MTEAVHAPTYADLTRRDRSPVKRWVQERRLQDALEAAKGADLSRVVDYGGGDGELSARLAERSAGEVVCFEPAPTLRREAEQRLQGVVRARVEGSAGALAGGWATTLFCLEVLEHLPEAETSAALDEIDRLLAPGATLVVGVPVEVGPPALAKGMFRAARRPASFDAAPGRIVACAFGRPPRQRPVEPIGPGLPYHPHHLGFDHRRLAATLKGRFGPVRTVASPFAWAPTWSNSEVYFVAEKAG